MKRKYTKPFFIVEEFQPNEAVSACTKDQVTEKKYNNQTITCVIEGTEYVFYDECTSNALNVGKLVSVDMSSISGECDNDSHTSDHSYTSDMYFVWYTGEASTQPCSVQQKAINKVLTEANVSGPGWHAGPATPEIITIYNMS